MTATRSDIPVEAALDDTGSGLAMFLIFGAAVLLVTGAVALVALVGTWWMLAIGFSIHVVMTVLVMGTIAVVIRDRSLRYD